MRTSLSYILTFWEPVSLRFMAVLMLMLASCEGGTEYSWTVVNNSSSEISAHVLRLVDSTTVSIQIHPNGEETVMVQEQLGGNATVQQPYDYLGVLSIIRASGDTCTKDPGMIVNWEVDIREESKIPSSYIHRYTFRVKDSDF